jgi:transcription elongation factor Elf1
LHEIAIPLAELRRLGFECARCKTGICLDLNEMEALGSNRTLHCPICKAEFDTNVAATADALRMAYQNMIEPTARDMAFRVTLKET